MRADKRIPLALIYFLLLGCSEVAMSDEPDKIDLGEYRSQAVFRATERFREDGYKWNGYRIIVSSDGKGIEVIFVPPGASGNDPWVDKPSSLPEVHYYLDVEGHVILRKLLGK